MIRTMSKLRALCSHPAELERPSKRRDDAAELGKELHRWVDRWASLHATGEPLGTDYLSEAVRPWAERLRASWSPPDNLECEVALGLAEGTQPFYVPVLEQPEGSHNYVPVDGATKLLTAGRADLVWPENRVVRVCDIKTGKFYLGDPKLVRQILAQGLAACLRADAEGFIPGVYYARLGTFDWGDEVPVLVGSTLWRWAWGQVYLSATMTSDPKPGGHCLSCWEAKHCRAYPGEAA